LSVILDIGTFAAYQCATKLKKKNGVMLGKMDLVIYRKAHLMMQTKKPTCLKFTITVESLADTESARLTAYNTTRRFDYNHWNTQV